MAEVASSDGAPYSEEEDRKRSVSAGQCLGLVGLVPGRRRQERWAKKRKATLSLTLKTFSKFEFRIRKDKGLDKILQTFSKLDFGSNQFSKIQ
jgi:hypothetical protein